MITTAAARHAGSTDSTLPPQGPAAPSPPFSPRERQVVELIAAGCSNREIAARLGLRTQTVKNHLCRIYRRLGLPNRVQLAVFAVGHRTGGIGW